MNTTRETQLDLMRAENREGNDDCGSENDDLEVVTIQIPGPDSQRRAAWGNKMQFFCALVSYAIGLANIWRFPYLCQQNGGGAFIIPYIIMLGLEGIPLFYLELGIGQKLRKGSIGVWNEIHPFLGGVGISSSILGFILGVYYNVIITWCLYYLFSSFQKRLPWAECPVDSSNNNTVVHECHISSATSYYWYRDALNISPSIEEFGGIQWKMAGCLCLAWIIVFFCIMKGIKSSGRVMYFTATFPYMVLIIFCGRALTLPGAGIGLSYMFTPDIKKLQDPKVWLDAATQIFYSLGLGFGSLIAFASYNPPTSNCRRDAILVSIINCGTSLFASIVVFAILGFKALSMHTTCLQDAATKIATAIPEFNTTMVTNEQELSHFLHLYNESIHHLGIRNCTLHDELSQSAQGTGLAFIIFAQAIIELPAAPLWSVLFFMMLLSLGLGTMIGTLEGVLTAIHDMNLFIWMKKWMLAAVVCSTALLVGMIFVTCAGEYWVGLFDTFSASFGLSVVAFMEMIGVIYIYGWKRFSDDLEEMTGIRPGIFWQATWRFVSPVIILVVVVASIVSSALKPFSYSTYNKELAVVQSQPYPRWAMVIAACIALSTCLPIPVVALLRYFKIVKVEANIPASVKRLNTTPSTVAMMRQNTAGSDDMNEYCDEANTDYRTEPHNS
ncbi:PREDICTED: sodium- and chloride-dependent transporter XTRP3A-like [Priapulus caudatus]|uniref:Transporter n=1 Tax=Priapulus caudatus TaxID=37621 RepID=A0ABM1DSG0_PRICU|nr:PREDICTED: sodium- and chloride-dependent transporter XTRP3A-like [Priapulus caudatus]